VFALSSEGVVCAFAGGSRTLERWSDPHAGAACALDATAGSLWVASRGGAVAALDPATLERLVPPPSPAPAVAAPAPLALRVAARRAQRARR
jgi:hypothetical protein